MADDAQNWKTYRSALKSHLQSHHCGVGNGVKLTVEQLEELHDLLHMDGYMCPPHEHDASEDLWTLGNVQLKYGEDYAKDLIAAVKGEIV